MGLLEKAEKIQSEEEQVPTIEPPKTVIVQEPEPVQKKSKKTKKSRPRRERKEKKAKKERVVRVIPEGFEPAARVRTSFRYLVDTTANWGILIITGVIMSQADADPTIPIIAALILALGNMIYLPQKISRSAGNIVTGTQFVDTRGNNPQFLIPSSKKCQYSTNASRSIWGVATNFGRNRVDKWDEDICWHFNDIIVGAFIGSFLAQ